MMNTLTSCNLNICNYSSYGINNCFFGNKNYLSLDIFLLFRFLSVKKFKNFKEDFTISFFLKLNKKRHSSQLSLISMWALSSVGRAIPF